MATSWQKLTPRTPSLPSLKRTFAMLIFYITYFYGRCGLSPRVKYRSLVSKEVNADAGVTVP